MRAHLRGAALLATIVAVAAGCSDPHPTPPPLGGTSGAATSTQTPAGGPSPTPTRSTRPSSTATTASTADRVAGQKAVQVFLARVNEAADAKSDAPLGGSWQPSCIWCATAIQPIQMAAFAKSWQLTPAKVSDPRVTYWKTGISGQLLYRVTMSVSAMKLVDDKGRTQRSSAAVRTGSFSFAAQKVGGRWQVVQGVHGDIDVPAS